MKVDAIIGIDPGANGGICLIHDGRVELHKMPKDMQRLKGWLEYVKENYNPLAFLEKLSVRPDDVAVNGDKANMGKLYRIQKMMANYEQLKATITYAGVPYIMVHPMSWQTRLHLRKKGEEKAERKKRYKDIAASLYPTTKQTMWSCDATLIMHFGRYMLKNEMGWIRENLPRKVQGGLF